MYVHGCEVCMWFVGVDWEMAVTFQNTTHMQAQKHTHIGVWKLVKSAYDIIAGACTYTHAYTCRHTCTRT